MVFSSQFLDLCIIIFFIIRQYLSSQHLFHPWTRSRGPSAGFMRKLLPRIRLPPHFKFFPNVKCERKDVLIPFTRKQ